MTSKQQLLKAAVEGKRGRNWYADAWRAIQTFCDTHDADPEKFVKVLAVLSPQISVAQNVHLAVGWCMFGVEPKVVRNVGVSFDRLRRSDYMLSAIKGPKTSRFARALLGDPDVVTLDTHMGYALKVPATQLKNKSIQDEADKRIGWVAKMLDWTPAEVQAAIWTTRRERAGYNTYTSGNINSMTLNKAWTRHRNNNPF